MRFLVLAAILCTTLAAVEPAVWPRYNGPSGDGWSPAKGLKLDWAKQAPKEMWRATLTDKGYAGPSSDGKAVYIIDHQGDQDIVRAFDLEKGGELWRFAYADNPKDNYGYARATPAIADGRVYTLGRLGQLHCLDAKTGATVWNVDIAKTFKGKAPQWQYSASPIIVGKLLIVAPGGADASVAALDPATGKTVWTGGGSDKPGYATPVVHDQEMALMTGERLLVLEVASGKTMWSHPWKTKYDVNSAAPLLTDAGYFVTSGYGTGCVMVARDGSGGKEVWKNTLIQSHMNSPILHEGSIYGTSDPNALVCLDAKTGAERWRQKGFGKGALMAVDGHLIATEDKSGETAVIRLDAKAYQEVGRLKPFSEKGDYWTQPVLAAGRLLLRSKTALVCYDLR